eukprot:Skav206187  [mRNA]  locus=scaffold1844:109778:119837:- [translate_table: standard]
MDLCPHKTCQELIAPPGSTAQQRGCCGSSSRTWTRLRRFQGVRGVMAMLYETLMAGTFLAAALPDTIVVLCFSGIGFSDRIFGLVAQGGPNGRELLQTLSAAISFLTLFLYVLLDIGMASRKVWLPYAFVSFACVLALSISVSLDYSWASPFLCLQSSFVILGYMRNNVYSEVSTKDYFTATALSFSICGSVMLAISVGWRMSKNAL